MKKYIQKVIFPGWDIKLKYYFYHLICDGTSILVWWKLENISPFEDIEIP